MMRECVCRVVADRSGFDPYGRPHDLTDDQILERLLDRNLERAGAQDE
jgi:hypothetical protein